MLSVKRFADPPRTVRPSPFWSWNERLELPELRRQIRLMKQQGYGGFFMHSRDGLRTGYLSSQWFQAVRACYQVARRLDMEAWLYDEDRWPSGAAGGLVTRGHPERAAKALLASRIRSSQLRWALAEPQTVAVYEVHRTPPRRLVRARRIRTVEGTEGELWRFHWVAQAPANWYNGATYIDILDPAVVERFLTATVDAYARHVGRCFGPHMPGIFTDEPNYGNAVWDRRGGRGSGIPYSLTLAEYFQHKSGMDLVGVLPDLFFDGPRSAAVRYAYFRCLALRMLESFTIPYARRCRQKGLLMTGHLLAEDDLPSQIAQVGFSMPHYWYMQAPGVDHLRRRHDHLLTHRQCSSAAQQAGRRRVLSELFGVSGQDMSFEDQKWIGDYHLVNGINLFCPHLTLYSMLGDGKRDFPPTFSYHQPYWPRMRVVNEYFARIGYLLSQGQPVADVLLLHSIGSAWAVTTPPLNDLASTVGPDPSAAGRLSSQLEGILAELLGDHRDVHLGDEHLLAKFGRIQNRRLICGRMAYELVIVPPSITWQSSTVQRLERFVAGGGKLIVVTPVPTRVDGAPAGQAWKRLLGHPNVVVVGRGKLLAAVQRALPRRVRVQDARGRELPSIRHALRRDGTRDIAFFCNTSRTRRYVATIRLPGVGRLERWDPLTGTCELLPTRRVGRHTVIQHDFPPAGSLALVLDRARKPAAVRTSPARHTQTVRLAGPWEFRRQHANSMTLDFCRYRVGGGRLSRRVPVWQVRHKLYELAGIGRYVGIQPWVVAKMGVKPKPLRVLLEFEFQSDLDRPKAALVVERLEQFAVRVNGVGVRRQRGGYHWDRKFGATDIGHLVRRGRNRMELTTRYSLETPIEDVYLVGDFATRSAGGNQFAVTAEPSVLRGGDWCPQGYHFYAGTMLYRTSVVVPSPVPPRVVLRLSQPLGCTFVVHANGREVGPIPWQPWEIELTRALRPGRNQIGIEVLGTLRNTFGPLHHTYRGGNYWWGPQSFVDREHWTDQYQFVPYGLGRGAELLLFGR